MEQESLQAINQAPSNQEETVREEVNKKVYLRFSTKNNGKSELNTVAIPQRGIYIDADLMSKETSLPVTTVSILIDSGSSRSLLSREVYERLPKEVKPQLRETVHCVKLADGSTQNCYGTVRIPVVIVGDITVIEFVVGDFSDMAILGMVDLQQLGFRLDFQSLTLWKGGLNIPVVDVRHNPLSRKVIVGESLVLPARKECIIKGHIMNRGQQESDIFKGTFMLENVQSLMREPGLVVGRTVHCTTDNWIPVVMYNPQDNPVVVTPKTVIGLLVPVEVSVSNKDTLESSTEPDIHLRKTELLEMEIPDFLRDVYERGKVHLDNNQSLEFKRCLYSYKDIFSQNDEDIGHTSLVEHTIDTGEAEPIRVPPRRLGPEQRKAADELIKGLLDRKLIEPSQSPWAAPIVMVKKKDGSFRLCLDYRVTVNRVSKLDGYPIPRIDSSLDCLANAKFFCSTDLSSGYWQIPMAARDKEKTAFCHQNGPSGGLYHWNVLPFGLNSAPATFQRMMDHMLSDLRYKSLLIYLDDICLFGVTFEQTLARLCEYFDRLRSANLKLKPSKCDFFQKEIKFLGHRVSEVGISTDPQKVEAVKDWPTPKTARQVKSFLGLASYYRRFINSFSTLAKPLTELTSCKRKFKWTEDCENSFQKLKECLISAPILGYPQEEGEFIVDTDASDVAVGGVLSQVQRQEDGTELEKVIAYGSRTLSPQEVNYCVTRRELLAIVHHLKLWKCYLLGRHFRVRTDHSSLKYLHRFKEPEGQLARWLDFLQTFDFEIVHRAGVAHGNADGLSRTEVCKKKSCYCRDLTEFSYDPPVVIETKVDKVDRMVQVDLDNEVVVRTTQVEFDWSPLEMSEAQKNDAEIDPVYQVVNVNSQVEWKNVSNTSVGTKLLLMERDRLVVREGLLYRKWEHNLGKGYWYQLVLPSPYREKALRLLHDNVTSGHLGVRKTYLKVRARFYWPSMREFIRRWVVTCDVCQQRKGPTKKPKGKMQEYLVGTPNERIAMDVMGPFSVTDNNNRWLLVIGDLFTRYSMAIPTPNLTAPTIAEAVVVNWVSLFGVPLEIHTDRAAYFEGSVFHDMCRLLGIHKTRTTAFRPQSDGFIERLNQTLNNMLNCVIQDNPFSWDILVKMCVLAYNSSAQESVGESPAMLMFGRELRLPIDVISPAVGDTGKYRNSSDYAQQLKVRLEQVFESARHCMKKATLKQQRCYNNRLKQNVFVPGSLVYLFNVVKGKSPKENYLKWKGPYVVTKKYSEAVYQIRRNSKSKPLVVNHDKLKPAHPRDDIDTSWIRKIPGNERQLSVVEAELDSEDELQSRPSRSCKAPDRLGEWYYGK